VDVSQAARLQANLNKCFQGVIPNGKGFLLSEQQAEEWIKADAKNVEVLKLFSMGANLAKNPHGKPERWIIDFDDMSIEEASDYQLPFEHIKTYVKYERDSNRDEKAKNYWWKFLRPRPEMRKAIEFLPFYFAVPCHSKWFIFSRVNKDWLPNNSITVLALDDFYILGILTSNIHRVWVKAQSSTLKGDTRYTNT
ncbi:MAG: type IIL restriction-modification enzyme MmeI, partial [Dolichospermum sp.]